MNDERRQNADKTEAFFFGRGMEEESLCLGEFLIFDFVWEIPLRATLLCRSLVDLHRSRRRKEAKAAV